MSESSSLGYSSMTQSPAKDGRQDNLFEDRVILDSDFFEQLKRHPVPLQDAAIRQLKDSSTALDIYVWLAYRLHHLDQRTAIGWRRLHQQFGAGYKNLFQFKPRFLQCLSEAVSAYPEARVTLKKATLCFTPAPRRSRSSDSEGICDGRRRSITRLSRSFCSGSAAALASISNPLTTHLLLVAFALNLWTNGSEL